MAYLMPKVDPKQAVVIHMPDGTDAYLLPAELAKLMSPKVGEVIRMQRWCAETNQPAHVCPGCTMVATGGRR